MFQSASSSPLDTFLVCGLGSLGQHCVLALKEFEIKIVAIEQNKPKIWEIPQVPSLIDSLLIGDCRQVSILQQANIDRCRSALLVTTSEQVNVETALAIRQLNPHTRLVMRSAKDNLNELLSDYLGNFIAYEPTQLPATAFTLAALGTETKGMFTLDGERLQVIQRRILSQDRWCKTRLLHELQSRNRRLLMVNGNFDLSLTNFHQWMPNATVQAGDIITYIEMVDTSYLQPFTSYAKNDRETSENPLNFRQKVHKIKNFWQNTWHHNVRQQGRRVAVICGLSVLMLWIIGTILLLVTYKGTTPLSAFSATAILLLGGYADLFGEFQEIDSIPPWLQLFSLGMTLAGTAFVGVLYALLTETLLSAKFNFTPNRPTIPQQNHIVVVGTGRVGQRVATLLQDFKQSLVVIALQSDVNGNILPNIPLITGNLPETLTQVYLHQAKSLVIVTDDEILNLEVALMAKRLNLDSHLVIRTSGLGLSQQMTQLLPNAQILGAYAVAAEVFAGAAFGENIVNLFRLGHQTILVTEYEIEANDTLDGLLLSEVAYGYGIVPILHQKPPSKAILMPSDDIRLSAGDRMVILATSEALQRIEQGKQNLSEKCYYLHVEKAFTEDSIFEGANIIVRISGCPLNTARTLMNHLPSCLEIPLYKHQGLRLVRALSKIQVKSCLLQ